MSDIAPEILKVLAGAAVGGLFTWFKDRRRIELEVKQGRQLLEVEAASFRSRLEDAEARASSLTSTLTGLQQRVADAEPLALKLKEVQSRLKGSAQIEDYYQPVILAGPRAVGKTSLLAQWHSPWSNTRLQATASHKICQVPIYTFSRRDARPHFADPEIMTDVRTQLHLNVHDFPGELRMQQRILGVVRQESETLLQQTRRTLGVVLVCLFDASEAKSGISNETREYYNGELFANLRSVVGSREARLERLICVFNKFDLLREQLPGEKDDSLAQFCVEKFQHVMSPLRGVCHPERVCEIFAILSRESRAYKSQGAPIVLGEAARNFVAALDSEQAAEAVAPARATNFVAQAFESAYA